MQGGHVPAHTVALFVILIVCEVLCICGGPDPCRDGWVPGGSLPCVCRGRGQARGTMGSEGSWEPSALLVSWVSWGRQSPQASVSVCCED